MDSLELSVEERAWLEKDAQLRARAKKIAERSGRLEEDIYKTLRFLQKTPGERLAIGLRHARLHPKYR